MTVSRNSTQSLDVITVTGTLKADNARMGKEKILSLIQDAKSDIILDLTEVEGVDLAGINILPLVHRQVRKKKHNLSVLVPKNSELSELIHLSKINQIFSVTQI